MNRSSNISRKPKLPELIVPGKNLFSQVKVENADDKNIENDLNDNSETTF